MNFYIKRKYTYEIKSEYFYFVIQRVIYIIQGDNNNNNNKCEQIIAISIVDNRLNFVHLGYFYTAGFQQMFISRRNIENPNRVMKFPNSKESSLAPINKCHNFSWVPNCRSKTISNIPSHVY